MKFYGYTVSDMTDTLAAAATGLYHTGAPLRVAALLPEMLSAARSDRERAERIVKRNAAIKIQSFFKGHLARKKLNKKRQL